MEDTVIAVGYKSRQVTNRVYKSKSATKKHSRCG